MSLRPVPSPSAPPALLAEVAAQSARETPPALDALVDALRARFGHSLAAVLMYGSCLHSGDPTDGIVDLYALVDGYRAAYPGWLLAAGNAAMPPNVFYTEARSGEMTLRAKYAVLTLDHFRDGASRWFHSYVWARFAQPSRVLWSRDPDTLLHVHHAVAHAALTFFRETLPTRAGDTLDAEGVWAQGLGLTYGSELRPEDAGRVRYLIERNLPDYTRLVEAAATSGALQGLLEVASDGAYRVAGGDPQRRRARRRWVLRRWQGRLLSVLRLGKSIFTFAGAVDYAVWKIERHTGIAIEVTPRVRRHPFLMGPWILWQLIRRGALR